ncbi:MAG: exodeoxyribonuclease V subunit gamma, partial [Ilumatobacteraceae bacterium]
GTWETGPLTWAVHAIQKEGGVDDLMRARAIADVFDRYILYRPHMVRRWSDGEDVDGSLQTLADHHLWQPELWRQLEARLGRSDARVYEQLTNASADEISFTGSIPQRVSIFGLTTMPQPQLDLFRVLSTKTEVAVFAPVSSSSRWESVRSAWREELRFPALRDAHPRPTGGFRLNTVWGRTNEEGHTLLLDSVLATSGEVEGPVNIKRDSAGGDDITLLSSLQDAIDHDTIPDAEVPLDRTVVIHRTFGATRQVEVLRDHLLHLFNERHRDGSAVFAPRDVVVLTNDVERFAPLVQSVFAGNPAAGVPDIPVQIADRSLGVTNPIATVGQQLLQLLDGRFRVDDVVGLLAQPVVAMSFDIEPADVPRVSELLTMANARWGLDGDDQRAVGIEPLGTFTLLDALNRLVSAVATAASGPELVGDRIAPLREVSFDDVALLGKTALFLQQLHDSCSQLNLFATPRDWFITFREALGHLMFVSDDGVLWWRAIDRLCEQLCDEVELAGDYSASVAVNPADLAVLVNSRLASTAGMPRFQTGRVTLSSLTAVRGVPHSVVCLLGVDREATPMTSLNRHSASVTETREVNIKPNS